MAYIPCLIYHFLVIVLLCPLCHYYKYFSLFSCVMLYPFSIHACQIDLITQTLSSSIYIWFGAGTIFPIMIYTISALITLISNFNFLLFHLMIILIFPYLNSLENFPKMESSKNKKIKFTIMIVVY